MQTRAPMCKGSTTRPPLRLLAVVMSLALLAYLIIRTGQAQ